jgi:hypothetical protein
VSLGLKRSNGLTNWLKFVAMAVSAVLLVATQPAHVYAATSSVNSPRWACTLEGGEISAPLPALNATERAGLLVARLYDRASRLLLTEYVPINPQEGQVLLVVVDPISGELAARAASVSCEFHPIHYAYQPRGAPLCGYHTGYNFEAVDGGILLRLASAERAGNRIYFNLVVDLTQLGSAVVQIFHGEEIVIRQVGHSDVLRSQPLKGFAPQTLLMHMRILAGDNNEPAFEFGEQYPGRGGSNSGQLWLCT